VVEELVKSEKRVREKRRSPPTESLEGWASCGTGVWLKVEATVQSMGSGTLALLSRALIQEQRSQSRVSGLK
jgi:hypothetical protein